MATPLVAITRPIPEPAPKILREKFRVKLNKLEKVLPAYQMKSFVRGADAILSMIPDQIDGAIMDAAGPGLKIIANYAVGFDNIDLKAAAERKIFVTNTPGVLTEAVAEHAFALLMSSARRIVESDTFTRKGYYKQWEPMGFIGPQLWGKTLGIVGIGRIGSWVAQIARGGYGMEIVYTDIKRDPEFEMRWNATYHELPTLLKESDFISLHVPLVKTTHHLIGEEELGLMKKTAILINTSRGPIVDEKALVKALRAGKIWGAGLDVFENEPKLTPGLNRLKNVVLTPHTASSTLEARTIMSKIAAENIMAALEGKTPPNLAK